MRVLRVYHSGRDSAHRARERALAAAGVEVVLAVPAAWPPQEALHAEPFEVLELPVTRPGDVNRHGWSGDLAAVLARVAPDVLDVHEEPVSVAARQWLAVAGDRPVVMYSAQNLDKRWPPPFSAYEKHALARVAAFYPCSRQAASVLRGKGFAGRVEVLPLGVDEAVFTRGAQVLPTDEVSLLLAGRLVPEKGVRDAVQVLAAVHSTRAVRLTVVGQGPEQVAASALAVSLGVADLVDWVPWVDAPRLAALYRRAHVVLLPSRATSTWVEQYGRVITEGWSCGAVPVGYASGSIPEVVGESGVTVPEGDVDALCRAVVGLLDDPARWEALRFPAASPVSSWAVVAQRQQALYDAVLTGPGPSAQTGRPAARAEFGPPAATSVSERPLALPVMRDSRLLHRAVERLGL